MDFADWTNSRPSYPVPSNHHQTILSKAVFEHCMTLQSIAAVAVSSRAIQNSSLPANCARNMRIDRKSAKLFLSVFHPDNNFSIQFCSNLALHFLRNEDLQNRLSDFSQSLRKTKYFHKSLRSVSLNFAPAGFASLLLSRIEQDDDHKNAEGNDNDSDNCFYNLEELALHRYVLTEADVQLLNTGLPSLRKLEYCCLPDHEFIESLEQLSPCARLQSLDMHQWEGPLDDVLPRVVSQFPNLLHLSLRSCIGMKDPDLCEVIKLEKLTGLNLYYCHLITEQGIKNFFSHPSRNMSSLTDLNMSYLMTAVTDSVIEVISENLRSLKILSLVGCSAITSGALKFLEKLSNTLTVLELTHDKVTDESVEALVKVLFPMLKRIELSYTRTTDEICGKLKAIDPSLAVTRMKF